MEELPVDVTEFVYDIVVQLVCGDEVGEQQLSEIGREIVEEGCWIDVKIASSSLKSGY